MGHEWILRSGGPLAVLSTQINCNMSCHGQLHPQIPLKVGSQGDLVGSKLCQISLFRPLRRQLLRQGPLALLTEATYTTRTFVADLSQHTMAWCGRLWVALGGGVLAQARTHPFSKGGYMGGGGCLRLWPQLCMLWALAHSPSRSRGLPRKSLEF